MANQRRVFTRMRIGWSVQALILLAGLAAGLHPKSAWAQTFTQLTTSTVGANWYPSISADGTRVAFESTSDLIPPGNADGNREIFLWTQGSGFTQLTTSTGGDNWSPSISADGTRVAFESTSDLIPPGNADGNSEIFLWTQGSGFTQLTTSTGGANWYPSISADGTRVAFQSTSDLIPPGNADGNWEIFLWTQGSGLTQLTTSTGGANTGPSIAADGTRVAFESTSDLIPPGNADGNWEIFLWTQGSGLTQLTTSTGGANHSPSTAADGTRIAFVSDGDLIPPGNADGNWEIFLWTQGSGLTQLTTSTVGTNYLPSISADGTRVAFESNRDLIPPGNADGNWEIFLWTQGSGLTQLTTSTGGSNSNKEASIAAACARVAFRSNRDLIPPGNADGNEEIFLVGAGTCQAQAIPTLSEWAQIGMAALLLGGGLLALRFSPTPRS